MAGGADEVVASAKVFLVGEYAECRGSVLLVAEGDDIGTAFFLDPTLRGWAALEFGDDAGVGSGEGLRHWGYAEVKYGFYAAVYLALAKLLLKALYLQAFIGYYFF